MKYANVHAYLDAAIERALASLQRRTALVAADELSRLGALAFPEDRSDSEVQASIDFLAERTAMTALAMQPNDPEDERESELILDRALLGGGFTIDVVKAFREYADARAAHIVRREAKLHSNGGAIVDNRSTNAPDVRAVVKEEVAAFLRTMQRGRWQQGAHYEQGQLVTDDGSMWSCQRDGTPDRPGLSGAWLLVVKHGRDARK